MYNRIAISEHYTVKEDDCSFYLAN